MSWVIWDILVPLVITFCLGLGLGWMLWRWRRQSASADIQAGHPETHEQSNSAELGLSADNEAMNIALIEERDHALRTANDANARVDALQERIHELENAASIETTTALSPSVDFDADSSVDADGLSATLEKERADKGRLETILLDANSRYKALALELESVVSGADAASVKDKAALQSKLERSNEKITELEKALHAASESESKLDDATRQIEALQAKLNSSDQTADQLAKPAQPVNEPGAVDTDDGKITDIRKQKSTDAPVSESSDTGSGSGPVVSDNKSTGKVVIEEAVATVETESALDSQVDSKVLSENKSDAVASADTAVKTAVVDKDEPVKEAAVADPQSSGVDAVKPAGSATTKSTKKTKSKTEELPSKAQAQSATDQKPAADGAVVKVDKEVSEDSGRNLKLVPNKKPAAASGYVPNGWEVPGTEPEKDERDNLTDIKGVGPVLEKALHSTGIYYFQQMAMLDDGGIDELQQQIPQFPGRIQRDQWVDQARELYEKKYGAAVG